MASALTRFAFIDSVHAAEILHVTQDQVLDWISDGRLRTFGGKTSNPFVRSADVAVLLDELGVATDEQPKRSKSGFARVQARLTADAKWSEISDEDISEWANRAESVRRQAARRAAERARERLEHVLRQLAED